MASATEDHRATAEAQQRIATLASLKQIHRAFHWLHLHQPQLRRWQLEMLAIPAPPFGERQRAEWFVRQFRELGLENVYRDEEGNALGELGSGGPGNHEKYILISAHLDTVFPAGTNSIPREEETRILCPGACDNAAGLSALLALIAAMRFAEIVPATPLLFGANVGEEGEGDLRGMRHLFERGVYRERISAALALEGAGTATAVTRALGSRRFRITVEGPGGHSWTDAGAPNPILLIAQALVKLQARVPPSREGRGEPRTTLNAGQISGGTSVNSIPSAASVLLDLRSTAADELQGLELEMHRAFESVISAENAAQSSPHFFAGHSVEVVGTRPAGELADDAPMLTTLRAVDRHLGLRTELRLGSTDANLPLSMGIPAIAIAAGGTGGGIHTLGEWYDPTGRELALRRILLLLADLTSGQPG